MAYTTSVGTWCKRKMTWIKKQTSKKFRLAAVSTDKLSTNDTESDINSATMKVLRINLMSVICAKPNGGSSRPCGYHTGTSKYSANSCRSFPIFSSALSRILSVASLEAIPFGCISKHVWSEQTDTQIRANVRIRNFARIC